MDHFACDICNTADSFSCSPCYLSVPCPEAGSATNRQAPCMSLDGERQVGKGSVFPDVGPGFLLNMSFSGESMVETAKWNRVVGFLQGRRRDSEWLCLGA